MFVIPFLCIFHFIDIWWIKAIKANKVKTNRLLANPGAAMVACRKANQWQRALSVWTARQEVSWPWCASNRPCYRSRYMIVLVSKLGEWFNIEGWHSPKIAACHAFVQRTSSGNWDLRCLDSPFFVWRLREGKSSFASLVLVTCLIKASLQFGVPATWSTLWQKCDRSGSMFFFAQFLGVFAVSNPRQLFFHTRQPSHGLRLSAQQSLVVSGFTLHSWDSRVVESAFLRTKYNTDTVQPWVAELIHLL